MAQVFSSHGYEVLSDENTFGTHRRTCPRENSVCAAFKPGNHPGSVQQALDDGWSVLAVHQTLYGEGRVTFSYQAFRRHVNQIHLGKPSTEQRQPRHPNKTTFKSSAAPTTGFSFDPSPKKEELL